MENRDERDENEEVLNKGGCGCGIDQVMEILLKKIMAERKEKERERKNGNRSEITEKLHSVIVLL